MDHINHATGVKMLQKWIIGLVIVAGILSIVTAGIISAALALFAFSLLLYYAFNNKAVSDSATEGEM